MVITITKETVEQAVKEFKKKTDCWASLCDCCPIHVALRPYMVKGPFEVNAKEINYYMSVEGLGKTISITDEANAFIKKFDLALAHGNLKELEKDLPTSFEVFKKGDKVKV